MRDLDNPRLTCILRNVSYNPLHGPSTTRDNPPASPATSRRTQTRRKHSASPGPDSPLTRPFSGSSSCGEQQPRPYTQNFHAQCPGSSRHPQERKGAQGNPSSSLHTHPLTGATDAFRTSVTRTPTHPCNPDMSLSSFHTQNLKKSVSATPYRQNSTPVTMLPSGRTGLPVPAPIGICAHARHAVKVTHLHETPPEMTTDDWECR